MAELWFDIFHRWRFERAIDRVLWRRFIQPIARRPSEHRPNLGGIRIVNRTGMPADWEFFDSQGNRLNLNATQVVGELTGAVDKLPTARLELIGVEWDVLFPDCEMQHLPRFVG